MNIKAALLIFFSIFYLGSLPCYAATSSTPVFNQAAFAANAMLYGNKTANLIELATIATTLNNAADSDLRFAVPPFFGLNSPEIIAYLKEIPYEADNTWNYVLAQWELFKSAQSQGATHLTNDARAALANIRKAIEHTYFEVSAIVKDQDRLEKLKTFLQTAIDQNKLLMVRSTGREDGKELSNAGGNASVASVSPTNSEQLSKAIQEVLSSYMSEKSIGQRLLGKDPHLFDEPFMAVLLQVMTGEVFGIDTEIPKSGVMFSPEAEGETPGVVVIQATFGHNEGVVNGLVPVDTYYVGPTNIVHPLISIKRKRLAAKASEAGLHFVDNQEALQRASTLDTKTVSALKRAAQAVQNYYDNAVDIEFVILGNVIYFVQARPLEAKKFEASYLKPEFIAQNQDQIIPVIPIGVGNAAVRIITNKDQVIVTDNIRQALDIFLFKTPDQDAIEAVIINESAPATSHEATQFRRLGKPVLYLEDLNTIKSWLNDLGSNPSVPAQPIAASSSGASPSYAASSSISSTGSNMLLIDAQRAVIIPFAPNDTFSTAEHTIEFGWYAHPIAKKVSLTGEFLNMPSSEEAAKLEPEEFFEGIPTSQLIDIIKEADSASARQAVQSLLHRVSSALYREIKSQETLKKTGLDTNDKLALQLKHIFAQIISSAHEINTALNNPYASQLERLYPITFLEALIRQVPEPNRLVSDYSFASILKTEKHEQSLAASLNMAGMPLRAHTVQYAKVGTSALVPETQEHWNTYIHALAKISDAELQNRFAQLMLSLSQLNVIPAWLNTSFEQAYTTHYGDALATARALLEEYAAISAFITQFLDLSNALTSFNASSFEDPNAFEKQFIALQTYIAPLTTPEFITRFDKTSNLGKIAALQTMHIAVSVFDTSIKALTGSSLYIDETQKVARFRIMLRGYLALLKVWILIPSIATDLEAMLEKQTFKTIQDYIRRIEMFPIDNDPKELRPSPRFNVAGATLGSKALWDRSASNTLTLEDIFTLIHQNLLIIEGILAKKTSLVALKIPSLVETLKHRANQLHISNDRDKANLIGIVFNNNRLIYYYNLPQRNHSSTFQIIYDLKTRNISLAVQFIGQARERWERIADSLQLFEDITGLMLEKLVELDTQRGSLSFTWKINTDAQAIVALKMLEIFAHYATGSLQRAYNTNNLLEVIANQTNSDKVTLANAVLAQKKLTVQLLSDLESLVSGMSPADKRSIYLKLIPLINIPTIERAVRHNIFYALLFEINYPGGGSIQFEDALDEFLSAIKEPKRDDTSNSIASLIVDRSFTPLAQNEHYATTLFKIAKDLLSSNNIYGLRLLATLINAGRLSIDEAFRLIDETQQTSINIMQNMLARLQNKNEHGEFIKSYAGAQLNTQDRSQAIAAINLLEGLADQHKPPLDNKTIEALIIAQKHISPPIDNAIMNLIGLASYYENWTDQTTITGLATLISNLLTHGTYPLNFLLSKYHFSNEKIPLTLALFDTLAQGQSDQLPATVKSFINRPNTDWYTGNYYISPFDLIKRLHPRTDLERFRAFLIRFQSQVDDQQQFLKLKDMIDQKINSTGFYNQLLDTLSLFGS